MTLRPSTEKIAIPQVVMRYTRIRNTYYGSHHAPSRSARK